MCHHQIVHFTCRHTATFHHPCAEQVDENHCSLGTMELERSEDSICPTCIGENTRKVNPQADVRAVSRSGQGVELTCEQDAKNALQKRTAEAMMAKKEEAGGIDWRAQLEAAVTNTKKGKMVRWADAN
jgi:hypothetical protein